MNRLTTLPRIEEYRHFPFYLLFFFMVSGCASQKNVFGDKKLIKTYKEFSFFNSYFSGVEVKDLESGKTLLNVNGDKLFTPASNTKLITFYIADQIFKDSIPSIKYCLWNDTVYFSGMGDPTLLHPDFEEQPVFSLLSQSPYQLAYSPSAFGDERYGPGWAWDDFPYYFQPEKSSFTLYGNCLWLRKEEWNELEIFPDIFDVNMTIDTSLIKLKTGRNEFKNLFNVSYHQLPEEINESVPFMVSDTTIISLLEDTLQRQIAVKNMPVFCNSQIISSQPEDSVYKKLLVESDNFIAEQLLLGGSAFLFDSLSSEKLIEYALDNYFINWKEKINWRDGSGLSRYNMLSPDFFIELLERIYLQNDWQRIKDLLPDGGKEGTMKNFLKSSEPFVFAKSGSMTGVYNLSGYLFTDKGKVLAFSIMNNNFNSSFKEVKAEIERFLRAIKERY